MEKIQLREELIYGYEVQLYESSGKVARGRFAAMVAMTCVVGSLCAILLMMVSGYGFYYSIATPLLLSLPVLGLIYLSIRWGRCRNALVGGLAGALMGFSFIGMFYLEGWLLFQLPEDGPAEIREHGGSNTPWGFYIYVAGMTGSNSSFSLSSPNFIKFMFFNSLELLGIILIGGILGRSASRRLYYEELDRWGDSKDLFIDPTMLDGAYDAIIKKDWKMLSDIPVSKLNPDPKGTYSNFTFEFLKDQSAPMFITLKAVNVRKGVATKCLGEGRLRGARTIIRQAYIPEDQYTFFAENFPELEIQPNSEKPSKKAKMNGPIEEF